MVGQIGRAFGDNLGAHHLNGSGILEGEHIVNAAVGIPGREREGCSGKERPELLGQGNHLAVREHVEVSHQEYGLGRSRIMRREPLVHFLHLREGGLRAAMIQVRGAKHALLGLHHANSTGLSTFSLRKRNTHLFQSRLCTHNTVTVRTATVGDGTGKGIIPFQHFSQIFHLEGVVSRIAAVQFAHPHIGGTGFPDELSHTGHAVVLVFGKHTHIVGHQGNHLGSPFAFAGKKGREGEAQK